jgi:hypothetical protein
MHISTQRDSVPHANCGLRINANVQSVSVERLKRARPVLGTQMPIRARLFRPLPDARGSIVEADVKRGLLRAIGIGAESKFERLPALQLVAIPVEPNARKRSVPLQVDVVQKVTNERQRVVRPRRSHACGIGSERVRCRLRRTAGAPGNDQCKNANPVSQSTPPNASNRTNAVLPNVYRPLDVPPADKNKRSLIAGPIVHKNAGPPSADEQTGAEMC